MNRLTDQFDLTTMTHSDTAVRFGITEQNSPSPDVIANLERLYQNVLLPLVKLLPGTLNVTCAYRCHKVNAKVGGKPASQHTKGEAADIEYYEGAKENNSILVDTILVNKIPFDQLITERGWIHVSYREGNNRHQFLKL